MGGWGMRSLLIVNADDFGISEGVNRGIAEGHQKGILTSTTLMANMPAFDHARQVSAENPGLAVGVHLTLTGGRPVLPPQKVPHLIDINGRFLRADRFLIRVSTGGIPAGEIEAELCAQVERALGGGFPLDHLDSHHHIHVHPAMQAIAIRIALRFGIRGIRCPVEISGKEMSAKPSVAKALVLGTLGNLLRLRARRVGLVSPDHFRGVILGMAFSTGPLHSMLRRLPHGITELMCHPGYPDEGLKQQTVYAEGRERELEALLDPAGRQILQQKGIALGDYSDLSF
ncbi:MAG TPA: ChbG/HpnK family deacetylase [Chloroflexota bacterium]|nr:ChbG/HpnK family deacetylase [Chloroflexota bacterium]